MIHTEQYRSSLPHQLHPNQSHLQPAFPGRFPNSNIETLNAVMLPSLDPNNHVQYPPMPSFVNTNVRLNEQHKLNTNDQRKTERSYTNESRDQNRDSYKTPENQFNQQTSQQPSQCFKPRKVDASTMTDPEEEEQSNNWQNVTVPTNTKVAEYLSSLRQFLKLNNHEETPNTANNGSKKVKKKRQLGDVRIMTAADGTRLFCCPECHVAYPDKSLLEPHLAGHKIERRWLCGVCGAGLKRKEHLDRHQLCHSDERPFACTACPKAFKRNEHLTRHYIIHTGEKTQGRSNKKSNNSLFTFSLGRTKYSIQDQKYSLETNYTTSVHDKKMMDKNILSGPNVGQPSNLDCNNAHTAVSSTYSLQIPPIPSSTAIPQANDSKYLCGVFGVTDTRQEQHRTMLSEEPRPFLCTTCGKGFKRNEHLIRHVETHSGQRKHVCGMCGKAFYRKDHLKKHVGSHIKAKKSSDGSNFLHSFPS